MQEVVVALERLVAAHRMPSASLAIRVDGVERLVHTVGLARLDPERPAVGDQPYDLASVTKPLAGAGVAAALIDSGALGLDEPARRYLPDVDPRVSVRHLLQHASGYPAWAPLYADIEAPWGTAEARRRVLDAARGTPLQAEPGAAHRYSDLGFLVLLEVLERVAGPLEHALHRLVLAPAGATDLRWGWPCAAATELCPVRGAIVEGTVHDLNCAAMGGVSTHAGLFGTARAVAALADAMLDAGTGRGGPLAGRALAEMWRSRGPGSHCCGWDGVTRGGYTSTGAHWPDDGVGHLGYTGTSLWLAPRQRTVVALLTNRVHPTDDKARIRAFRPAVHDVVARALGWDRDLG